MVFIRPITDGIHNVLPYHAALARRIISTAGTARIASVLVDSGKIPRHKLVNTEFLGAVYMVINDIHDDTDACLM